MADEQPAIPLVPVALPPLNNIINLPPRPQNPPVAKDVAEGHKYEKEISIAHADRAVSDEVLADSLTYKMNLLQARAGIDAAPPWFRGAMQQVLDEALHPIIERLDRLTALATETARLSAVGYNLHAGSGSVRSLEIVPFRDGSYPTSEEHDLPPLLNKAAVTALDNPQSKTYYRGYHGADGHLPAVPRRKELILDAIGCK